MPPEVGVAVEFVPPLAIGNVPVTPVDSGNPVAFDNTTALGVPKAGVVKVGEVDNTTLPEPVAEVTPVPPCATSIVDALHVPLVIVPTVAISVLTNFEAGIDPLNLSAVILPASIKLVTLFAPITVAV